MVIAVWLTLNVSADATGLLERPGPRPVDAGRGYRPVSRSTRRAPPVGGFAARRCTRETLRSARVNKCTRRDRAG
jgi:hypothetical protein